MFGRKLGCCRFRCGGYCHIGLDEFQSIDAVLVDYVFEIRLGRYWLYRACLPNRDDMTGPLFLEDPLDALDGETLIVQEVPDALEQLHIVGAIVSPPAATLQRLDLREPRFPETQHVLR